MLLFRFSFLLVFGAFLLAATTCYSQWEQINGKGGASVTCFAASGDSVFAGTNNGVIVSIDNGITWNSCNAGLSDSTILDLFTFDSVLFVSTAYSGLYRWDALHHNWDSLSRSVNANSVTTLGPFLFACDGLELFSSTDKGKTWNPLSDQNIHSLAVLSTELFAGTNSGVLCSVDFGQTWQPPSDNALQGTRIPSVATVGSNLLAGSASQGTPTGYPNGIFLSTDYGSSWELVCPDPNIYVWSFFSDSTSIYAATADGLLRSTDSGMNWTPINSNLTNLNVQAGLVHNGTIYAGTQGDGVFRSTNGAKSWTSCTTALDGTYPQFLFDNGSTLFVGTTNANALPYLAGVVRSGNEGLDWYACQMDSIGSISGPFAETPDMVYTVAFNNSDLTGTLYASADNGLSWQRKGSVPIPPDNILALSTFGSLLLCGTEGDGILLSSDSGATWSAINSGLGANPSAYSFATKHDTMFAATNRGVVRSTDTGASWEPINTGLQDTNIYCLTFVGSDLFAADRNGFGVSRSTDDGEHWTDVSTGLSNSPWTYSFAVKGSDLFVGTANGIYLTTDLGNNWSSVSNGLPFGATGDFVGQVTLDSTYLFVTTYSNDKTSNGVWRRRLSEVLAPSSVPNSVVTVPSLQCYPNPVLGSTTISCNDASSGYAEISIVNLLGLEVAKLFSGELEDGNHSFEWNASGVPDGVYECVVRRNGEVRCLPIVVSK